MTLTNNLYFEVLYAHFNHALSYKEAMKVENEVVTCNEYQFPPNFFKWLEDLELKTNEEIEAYHFWIEAKLTSMEVSLPKLQGVADPIVKWGLVKRPFLFKKIIVPHFDGSASILIFHYHFYRLGALFKYFTTRNSSKKTDIFITRLRTKEVRVLTNLYPSWQGNKKSTAVNINEITAYRDYEATNTIGRISTRQHCLLILYLLKGLGIDYNQESLIDMAKVVSVIMGKDYIRFGERLPKMEHSYIYKTLKKIRKLSDEELLEDLMAVKNTLEWCSGNLSPSEVGSIINSLEIKTKRRSSGQSL